LKCFSLVISHKCPGQRESGGWSSHPPVILSAAKDLSPPLGLRFRWMVQPPACHPERSEGSLAQRRISHRLMSNYQFFSGVSSTRKFSMIASPNNSTEK